MIDKFNRIKEKIENAKNRRNVLKGKISVLTQQLKKCGFKNVKQAKAGILKKKKKLKKDKRKLEKELSKITAQFPLKGER